jgi:hypothetical protein
MKNCGDRETEREDSYRELSIIYDWSLETERRIEKIYIERDREPMTGH